MAGSRLSTATVTVLLAPSHSEGQVVSSSQRLWQEEEEGGGRGDFLVLPLFAAPGSRGIHCSSSS